MSKAQIQCPHCKKNIIGDDKHLGKSLRCPSCKQPFRFGAAIQQPKIGTGNQEPRYSVKGVAGLLKVHADCVEITPNGFLGAATVGFGAGTKKIPFASMTAVQFKEATPYWNGFLQFSMMGGTDAKGGILGAVRDENAFVFARFEGYELKRMFRSEDEGLNEKMREIKNFIEERIGSQPQAHNPSSNDELDKIRKLANLRKDGIISDEEFRNQKSKLLNSF